MPTPHVHAEVIKAFANGYTIETQAEDENWVKCENPRWVPYKKYRVKKEKKEIILWAWIYPTTGNLKWRHPHAGQPLACYERLPSEDKIITIEE